jgi:hypothetical protein
MPYSLCHPTLLEPAATPCLPACLQVISIVGFSLGLLLGFYNIVMLAKHYKQLCITYEVLLPNKQKSKPGFLKPGVLDPQQQQEEEQEDNGRQPSPRPAAADGAYVATVSNEALRQAVKAVGLTRKFQVATTIRRRAVGTGATPSQSMNAAEGAHLVSTRWRDALDAISREQAAAKAAAAKAHAEPDQDVTRSGDAGKDQDQGGDYIDEEVSELVLPEQDRARAEALRVAAAASLFGATVSMSWVVMNVAANLIVLGIMGLVIITRIYPV